METTIRIAFDAKRAYHNHRGLGNYSRDVIRLLTTYAPENEYLLYAQPTDRYTFPHTQTISPRGVWSLMPSLWRSFGCVNDLDGVEESLVTEWDNQLVALVVTKWEQLNVASLREKINSLLPKDSQLQKIETQSDPLEHTPKHSIKRYLYRKRAEWEARQAKVKGEK